ncbi:hypothetical protein [Streptomyces acidiscabies]|uniref:Uncharacterized protein n=1 Tax=Streptomyces acidiscabies TaxID=42234 RepID=A0AAP6BEH6_9ACTN|nr:hypothetical protein [Streptomyces acidiscabies]MBP5941872.1 acetyltransferase [Streptomyces sp. LBUM 1476]MBZ3913307.1 hypothetical protein [Streptomyces acidiscabies]MDX2963267.1 hypothetical protein [Streptomyces acidiscabies]MDX3021515.1 hypothetical protein [Streptomyces acidiscabies]MDX3790274.1 hypothetical protein [Streptomyces acidiscabies]
MTIHQISRHPVRACYPYGAHDLLVEPPFPSSLPAVFAAHPRCRRLVAAPAEDDTSAQLALESAGFRRITEADLPTGTVVLYVAEPPEVMGVSTALDDMPH